MKYSLLIIIIVLSSCKTKQKIVEKTEIRSSDTLIMKTTSIETPPILSSLTINEICDTITGKAKEFKNRVVIDKDTVYVEVIDNELNLTVNRIKQTLSKKDSIISIRDTQIKELKSKETKVYRTPFKIWVFLIVSILGNIYLLYKKFRNKLPF